MHASNSRLKSQGSAASQLTFTGGRQGPAARSHPELVKQDVVWPRGRRWSTQQHLQSLKRRCPALSYRSSSMQPPKQGMAAPHPALGPLVVP